MRTFLFLIAAILPSQSLAKSVNLDFEVTSISREVETNNNGYRFNAETATFKLLTTSIAGQPISPSGFAGYPTTTDQLLDVSSLNYRFHAPHGMFFHLNSPDWGGSGMNAAVTLVSNYQGSVLMKQYESQSSLDGFSSGNSGITSLESDQTIARVQTLQPFASDWGSARWVNVFSNFKFSEGKYSFDTVNMSVNFSNPIDIAPLSIGIIAELYVLSADNSNQGFVAGEPLLTLPTIPIPASGFMLFSVLVVTFTSLRRNL